MSDSDTYFEAISAGDTITIAGRSSFGPTPVRALTVDRVTKTQIISGGYRFRRFDGRQVGDYFHGARIALPEDAARMRAEWHRYAVKQALARGCTMELAEIERMSGLLAEARVILEAEKARIDA